MHYRDPKQGSVGAWVWASLRFLQHPLSEDIVQNRSVGATCPPPQSKHHFLKNKKQASKQTKTKSTSLGALGHICEEYCVQKRQRLLRNLHPTRRESHFPALGFNPCAKTWGEQTDRTHRHGHTYILYTLLRSACRGRHTKAEISCLRTHWTVYRRASWKVGIYTHHLSRIGRGREGEMFKCDVTGSFMNCLGVIRKANIFQRGSLGKFLASKPSRGVCSWVGGRLVRGRRRGGALRFASPWFEG